jgi:hypothetical protein
MRGLAGLGGAALSAEEVFGYLRGAGFDPERARMLVAIGKRESGLDPSRRCLNCVPKKGGGFYEEDSIGLFQINMRGALGVQRMAQLGLSSPTDLFDPAVSARAAFLLWGGNDSNLNTLWSINRDEPFPYRQLYLQNLAALPSAALLEGSLMSAQGGGASPPDDPAAGDNTRVYAALAIGAGVGLVLAVLE